STFFASPAVKIHQIKKHVLFNSRPLAVVRLNRDPTKKRIGTGYRNEYLGGAYWGLEANLS
ncbi:MAG: hypothetical protein ACI9G6_003389, partial [Limisphaerales bacterium]